MLEYQHNLFIVFERIIIIKRNRRLGKRRRTTEKTQFEQISSIVSIGYKEEPQHYTFRKLRVKSLQG